MGYNEERRGFRAPIDVGETYDVTIEDVGREGDGIARIEGFVVFVPNTNKGDTVKIRVTKVSRRVGFAEVVAE
jgi:predicted RNA-binding protein with TRAM domain